MREDLKRLHAVWFHPHDILEKLSYSKKISSCQIFRDKLLECRGFLGQWSYFV